MVLMAIQGHVGLCRAEGHVRLDSCFSPSPSPTEIKWSRANESLPERALIEGEVLTIPSLSMLDNGTYSCQVANKHGRSSDQYVLVVYGKQVQYSTLSAFPDFTSSTLSRSQNLRSVIWLEGCS